MTHELSEIALAFAKEILGWKQAEYHAYGDHFSGGKRKHNVVPEIFRHTDLNVVMSAVRAWVNTMPGWFMQITSEEDGWLVWINGPDDDGIARGSELCEVMMKACLQAKAKIDGIKE